MEEGSRPVAFAKGVLNVVVFEGIDVDVIAVIVVVVAFVYFEPVEDGKRPLIKESISESAEGRDREDAIAVPIVDRVVSLVAFVMLTYGGMLYVEETEYVSVVYVVDMFNVDTPEDVVPEDFVAFTRLLWSG